MASFASSATTCGARKHAWTNIVYCKCSLKEHYPEIVTKHKTVKVTFITSMQNTSLRFVSLCYSFKEWSGSTYDLLEIICNKIGRLLRGAFKYKKR